MFLLPQDEFLRVQHRPGKILQSPPFVDGLRQVTGEGGLLGLRRRPGEDRPVERIDDVGFGNSCLESLVLLEPDILKIDRKCVTGLERSGPLARSLKRLLDIARVLDMDVVAEGIEAQQELDILRDMGVRYGQGYLLGRPE